MTRIETVAGAASSRAVLCLHCSTGSSRQWRSLAGALGEEYRIIAPDLLGYGENAPWTPGHGLRLETEVRRLLPWILSAPGPVDVVAHSFGAAVAVKLALTHPDKVRSLTLYEPVLIGLLTEDDATALDEITMVSGRVGGALSDGDTDAAARHFVDFWSGAGTWSGMGETRREGVRTRIEKVRADFGALLTDDTTLSDLERLDIPVLCLSGNRSPAATRRVADRLADAFPDARTRRFEEAGHMGPITHAEEVNASIAEFFRFLFARRTERVPYTPVTARAA
jgi:pimeloyl-ACP methyl ester carboxylesterase